MREHLDALVAGNILQTISSCERYMKKARQAEFFVITASLPWKILEN